MPNPNSVLLFCPEGRRLSLGFAGCGHSGADLLLPWPPLLRGRHRAQRDACRGAHTEYISCAITVPLPLSSALSKMWTALCPASHPDSWASSLFAIFVFLFHFSPLTHPSPLFPSLHSFLINPSVPSLFFFFSSFPFLSSFSYLPFFLNLFSLHFSLFPLSFYFSLSPPLTILCQGATSHLGAVPCADRLLGVPDSSRQNCARPRPHRHLLLHGRHLPARPTIHPAHRSPVHARQISARLCVAAHCAHQAGPHIHLVRPFIIFKIITYIRMGYFFGKIWAKKYI